ncbi:MAG TPA: hypothetical protein VF401_03475 [Candidatus Saccharimonadales bacterium]
MNQLTHQQPTPETQDPSIWEHPRHKLLALGVAAVAAIGAGALIAENADAQSGSQASSTKYYGSESTTAATKFKKLTQDCLPQPLAVNTHHNSNDTPSKHNSNGKLWVTKTDGGNREVFHWTNNKHRKVCGIMAGTLGGQLFFPKPTKITATGGEVTDSATLIDGTDHPISSFQIWFKKTTTKPKKTK